MTLQGVEEDALFEQNATHHTMRIRFLSTEARSLGFVTTILGPFWAFGSAETVKQVA